MSTSSDQFNEFIESILKNPKAATMLFVLVGSSVVNLPGMFLAGVIWLCLEQIKIPKNGLLATVVICLILVILNIVFSQGNIQTLVKNNYDWIKLCFNGHFNASLSLYLALVSLPYALLLASLITLFYQPGVGGDLKRISKGRHRKIRDHLSDKKITKKLALIPSAKHDTGTILGVDVKTGKQAILSDQDANLHTLVFGTTGGGKTTTLKNIIESNIDRKRPVFYVDGKGDLGLAYQIRDYCKKTGTPFYLFSMVNGETAYNPLSLGGYTAKKDRIIGLRKWSEDHYRILAEGYLQTVMKVLERSSVNVDITSLAKYCHPSELMMLCREIGDQSLSNEVAKLDGSSDDMQSLIGEITNLANSEIGHLFDTSKSNSVITLDQVMKEGGVAYFSLQPLLFPAYASTVGKLIINDLKALASTQLKGGEIIPIQVLFDELYLFIGPQIVNLINQGRSAGVHAVLSTQSPADLKEVESADFLDQVIDNVNNYIVHRINSSSGAELMSSVIGTNDGFEVTSQLSLADPNNHVGSVKQTKEFVFHPDQIKRLEMGQAIYLNKRQYNCRKIKVRLSNIIDRGGE